MSYLYNELPTGERPPFAKHLESCVSCREQVKGWQQTGHELNHWKLAEKKRQSRGAVLSRWAIAAAFVGLATVGGVRLVAMQNEVDGLRAELKRQVERDTSAAFARMTEQTSKATAAEAQLLIGGLLQNMEERRAADQHATLDALEKINAQRLADYASLRKELETVAVFSEAGLQRAQNQISTLAHTSTTFPDIQ